MQKFYVDNNGVFLGGFDGLIPEGGIEAETPPTDGRQIYQNGAWQPLNATQTYAENRACEYPVIGEQLDMLWHAMDDGTATKIEPFYSSIMAVKDKYPKGG